MTKKLIVLGGVFAVAGAASADLVDVTIVNAGNLTGDGTSTTYQVYANFDAVDDQLLAVGGLPGVGALEFSADSALIQNAGAFDGLRFGDTPNIFDAGGDSWVSVGDPSTHNTSFSPGFGGDPTGNASVISGSSFSEANGGYFDENPGTIEGGAGSLIIAQFTLANESSWSYTGLINWSDDTLPSGEFNSTAFAVAVAIPAPGAVALLGLAGLAGTRRRRG